MSLALRGYSKAILLGTSLGVFVWLAYKFRRGDDGGGSKPARVARGEVHEALMFAHDVTALARSPHSRCLVTAATQRLLHHLSTPRHSLDVCVYVMTNLDLVNAVLKLHYRGVKVRIITDADMAYSSSSFIGKFVSKGIPVRWKQSSNLLHHKFCLLDASAAPGTPGTPVVMTGSLNWTNQALYGNWENLLVTSQHQIVEQYRAEFERLWEMFSPVTSL